MVYPIIPQRWGFQWMTPTPVRPQPIIYPTGWFGVVQNPNSADMVSVSFPNSVLSLVLVADATSFSVESTPVGFDSPADSVSDSSATISPILLAAMISGSVDDTPVVNPEAGVVSVSAIDGTLSLSLSGPAVSFSTTSAGVSSTELKPEVSADASSVSTPEASLVRSLTGVAGSVSTPLASGLKRVELSAAAGSSSTPSAALSNVVVLLEYLTPGDFTLTIPNWVERIDIAAIGGGAGGSGGSGLTPGYLGFGGKWAYTNHALTPGGSYELFITVGQGGAGTGWAALNPTPPQNVGNGSLATLLLSSSPVHQLVAAGGNKPGSAFFTGGVSTVRNLGGAPKDGNSRNGVDVVLNGFTYTGGGRSDSNAGYATDANYTNGMAGSNAMNTGVTGQGYNTPGIAPGGAGVGGAGNLIGGGYGGNGAPGAVYVRFFGETTTSRSDPPFDVEEGEGNTDAGYVLGYPLGEGNPVTETEEENPGSEYVAGPTDGSGDVIIETENEAEKEVDNG